jgi:hypothetical protein
MGAVAYTSTLADADFESEREREYRHIMEVPNLERQEICDIYANKGSRAIPERIVDTITADKDVWVADDGRGAPVDLKEPQGCLEIGHHRRGWQPSSIFDPIDSFFLPCWDSDIHPVSAVVLFVVGVYKAR